MTLPELTDEQVQELAVRAGSSTITILRRIAGLPVLGQARVALIDRVLAEAFGAVTRKKVTLTGREPAPETVDAPSCPPSGQVF